MIASLVIFLNYLSAPARNEIVGALHTTFGRENVISLLGFIQTMIPLLMIILAFLMVSSRVRYVHVLNKIFKEKRTFDYFTYLIFSFVLIALIPQITLVFIFAGYVALGPIQYAVCYFRSKSPEKAPAEDGTVR